MPIDIVGQASGSERDAGEELARLLTPIATDDSQIAIVVGAKCYGQRRQDIDLLLLASFGTPIRIPGPMARALDRSPDHTLSSLALILEVKDHRPSDVRLFGNHVEVAYDGQWRDVTTTVWEQRFSVRDFLRRAGLNPPFVYSAIWLRNCQRADLPRSAHNILPAAPTLDDLFSLIVSLHGVVPNSNANSQLPRVISSGLPSQADGIRSAASLFCREIRPTELDRRKLERICERKVRDAQYLENLGRQLLIFKGRGGVGKTFRLLQIAKFAHDQSGARVLFLTYNRALAADVRRLLAILGVRDKTDEATICVSTSEAYFWSVMKAFDLCPTIGETDDFPEAEYLEQKVALLDLLRSATPEEVRTDPAALRNPEAFLWDFVCIDEGQDWPSTERDLLAALFGPERIVVADGVDQLVRGGKRCDWPAIAPRRRQIVTLRKSMRLKANLCRFVTMAAAEIGANWEMEPDPGISGGRIMLLRGEYSESTHRRILGEHVRLGNAPIDLLCCITGSAGSESMALPTRLKNWGHKVWNGADELERDTFATDTDQIRIVKYESVRGLEGWTVVCLDLDKFFSRQMMTGLAADRDALVTAEEAATTYANQWALIPMTRAVDTLVLQIRDDSHFSRALLRTQVFCRDFCEIIQ